MWRLRRIRDWHFGRDRDGDNPYVTHYCGPITFHKWDDGRLHVEVGSRYWRFPASSERQVSE